MIRIFFYQVQEKSKNRLYYSVRLRHILKEKQEPKSAPDVAKFLDSTPENRAIKDKLPKYLLRKFKAPESMYLINRNTAKVIANEVKKYLYKDSPIIEVNPGLGMLTEEILNCQENPIYIYETSHHFTQHLNVLENQYPERITFKQADFFGMWKLAFQDKMDHGNRIQELLGSLATNSDDRLVKIIGSMPGLSFVRHLINNIVFNNATNQLGRPDLFITMPGHQFEFLTDNEVQCSKQKTVPTLFQLFFDCKILTNVPRVHFLPWTTEPVVKKRKMMDDYNLYLVNIIQKEKLPCSSEYLPLLWYFFRPHTFSKTTKVIPMLEQWIPGCGVWLITGQDPPDTNRLLSPGPDDSPLPHMTIFTEFGDLNLKQKITVFKRFISWPEFDQCQFRVTMESNLPKYVTELDDEKDSISTHIDVDHSDAESDPAEFDK